ncbi:MAG: DJ-1/PfpI family protein [Tannerellaceae bacterium]|jgi:4-methyl-5(b-hydroxyethyl)-thiazole monophosphate biosynthesis|nr:DJ-1/PfpI family protein [Tannerellaceae bacterium]
MKKAFVFLTDGFEEIEATGTIDVLRRGGIETTIISVSELYESCVPGAHDISVGVDNTHEYADFSDADILILPGGMPGADNLNNHKPLIEILKKHYDAGKWVAAICAAPLVFGGLGFLKGRKATCYPGFESALEGAEVTGNPVEIDGNVITAKGPGFVFDFALTIIEILRGKDAADEVAEGLLLR